MTKTKIEQHVVRVKIVPVEEHHDRVVAGDLFQPRCGCGWEGALMLTREEAQREAQGHVRRAAQGISW